MLKIRVLSASWNAEKKNFYLNHGMLKIRVLSVSWNAKNKGF